MKCSAKSPTRAVCSRRNTLNSRRIQQLTLTEMQQCIFNPAVGHSCGNNPGTHWGRRQWRMATAPSAGRRETPPARLVCIALAVKPPPTGTRHERFYISDHIAIRFVVHG
ncbi:unnamed protein product, partial [Brenthis ino]